MPYRNNLPYRSQARRKQKGLSIIELMIALTLGLILLAGVIQIFMANRETSRVQNALARVQENGRVVMEFLAREIRAADYWGCAPNMSTFTNHLDTSSPDYDPSLHDFSFADGIAGTNDDGVNGSDSITLSGLFGEDINIIQPMPDPSAVIKIPPNNNLVNAGDILFISNCKGGDIFQVTAGSPGSTGTVGHQSGGSVRPGNAGTTCNTTGATSCPNCFCQSYGIDAMLHTGFNSSRYYIDNTPEGPTLFVDDFYNSPMQLAKGIENMQISYGMDTTNDGSANRYLPAGHVDLDMNGVVSIKVNILVASDEAVADTPQQLRFNWEEIKANTPTASGLTTASDNRLRRSYSMTVNIRNRTQ